MHLPTPVVLLAAVLPLLPACGKSEPGAATERTVVRFLDAPEPGGGWEEIVARF